LIINRDSHTKGKASMGKHPATSVAQSTEVPTSVWCAIDRCFGDESERSLEAVIEAVRPCIPYDQCLAAFREWVKDHPRFKNAFATDEEKAARGLREVVLAVLRRFQEEGAATFKGICALCGGVSVVLTRKNSTTLRARIRPLNAAKANAWRAGVVQSADGRSHTKTSLMQRLCLAMGQDGWHQVICRLSVDTVLERLANSPEYRTETKDGMRRLRLKVNSPPAGLK
jgi:hypothetical protein